MEIIGGMMIILHCTEKCIKGDKYGVTTAKIHHETFNTKLNSQKHTLQNTKFIECTIDCQFVPTAPSPIICNTCNTVTCIEKLACLT